MFVRKLYKYMKKIKLICACCSIFFCIILVNSCATVSYSPNVRLDLSPLTIKKSLEIAKFVDNTPEKDKRNPFNGFSVTNKKALVSELSIEVTNAIVYDFSTNAVFKQCSRRIENPDFIMKGEIKRFLGKSRMTKYGLISMCTYVGILTWYFGLPVRVNETEMQLVISIYDSKQNLVGAYTSNFKDRQLSSIYKDKTAALLTLTNKSFSSAVQQIRDQILVDIAKYEK
jgi:hypothetical protein